MRPEKNIIFRPIILTGTSVTAEDVKDSIILEKYIKTGRKIMVCHLTLRDGYEVVGTAGVVNPENFNEEVGKEIALKNAVTKVWQHLGSILQHQLVSNNPVM